MWTKRMIWTVILFLFAFGTWGACPNKEESCVILLEAPTWMDFQAWRGEIESQGVQIRHAFPPVGGLVILDETDLVEAVYMAAPTGTAVFEKSPEGIHADRIRSTDIGRVLWHAQRALLGLEETEPFPGQPPGSPLIDDALTAPSLDPEVVCNANGLLRSNSEYMLGSVSVNVILPESDGTTDTSTEDWTSGMETSVTNEITQGLNDLTAFYSGPVSLTPSWTYHYYYGRTNSAAQTQYEPINRTQADEPLWVEEIYDALGYSSEVNMWEKGRKFAGDTRTADGTTWS